MNSQADSPLVISRTARPATPEELHFVTATWMASYRDAPRVRRLPGWFDRGGGGCPVFNYVWAPVVDALLEECAVQVVVTEGGLLMGWACHDPLTRTLHYAYVRPQVRGEGILRELLRDLSLKYYSLVTIDWMRLRHAQTIRNLKYRPLNVPEEPRGAENGRHSES